MRLQDLHTLPKVRDSWSLLYVEHCRVDQEDKAIAVHDQAGVTPVPCASLSLLMVGPGTNITQAAILTLADCGCMVVWCGEQGVRFYAQGGGETRSAANLMHQARLWARKSTRLQVAERLYRLRFAEEPGSGLTLQQLRGYEGVRVRDAYAHAAKAAGVEWAGRSYDRGNWNQADPVNRALSCANSCLYGLCHSAIVAMGYSPGLGFIHIGKQLSFVYDIADLYKVEVTVPLAFATAGESPDHLERRVRLGCRDAFAATRLLERVAEDIPRALDVPPAKEDAPDADFDADPALPGGLWDPQAGGEVPGGVAYGTAEEESDAGAAG